MKLKIGDIMVYIFIVILISFSLLGLSWMAESVSKMRLIVELNGEVVQSIDLDENTVSQDIRIETGNGGYNILRITQSEIKVVEANCPDQVCVRSRPITIPGQTIICLPHRLIIKIVGDTDSEKNIDSTAS